VAQKSPTLPPEVRCPHRITAVRSLQVNVLISRGLGQLASREGFEYYTKTELEKSVVEIGCVFCESIFKQCGGMFLAGGELENLKLVGMKARITGIDLGREKYDSIQDIVGYPFKSWKLSGVGISVLGLYWYVFAESGSLTLFL